MDLQMTILNGLWYQLTMVHNNISIPSIRVVLHSKTVERIERIAGERLGKRSDQVINKALDILCSKKGGKAN